MNSSEIEKIRGLSQEAQHSYMCAASIVGLDTILNKVLLKWSDIIESILNFEEDNTKETFDTIISDIAPLIYAPIFAIAESFIQLHAVNDEEYNHRLATLKMTLNVAGSVHIKNEVIKIIKDIDPKTVIKPWRKL